MQASKIPPYCEVEARFGRMMVLRGDSVIGRSLRIYGEFAGTELDAMLTLLRPGMSVVDVGANIGVHTLAFAAAVGPSGEVTSIEPQRHCFHLLCANTVMNQHQNVNCIRAAAGDVPGSCRVPVLSPTKRQNFGAFDLSMEPEDGTLADDVPIVTIDGLNLRKCDFIKVDVEGHEVKVLRGATETIARFRPVFYVEVHSQQTLREAQGILGNAGYSCVLHDAPFFRAKNHMGESATIFAPGAGGTALVAMPDGNMLPPTVEGRVRRPAGW